MVEVVEYFFAPDHQCPAECFKRLQLRLPQVVAELRQSLCCFVISFDPVEAVHGFLCFVEFFHVGMVRQPGPDGSSFMELEFPRVFNQ